MAVNVSVGLKTSLQQTLTPQQIQYLKLLQMPIIQFEQEIKKELDENPLLEIAEETNDVLPDESEFSTEIIEEDLNIPKYVNEPENTNDGSNTFDDEFSQNYEVYFDDVKIMNELPLSNYVQGEDEDPYHLYTLMLQDDAELST